MTNRNTSLSALENCFTDLEALLLDLEDSDWETQSLCPDWNTKGVVTHLAGIENLLLG